jgi:hypothetical protein
MQLDYADETKRLRLVVYVGPSLNRDVEQAARADQRLKGDWVRKVLREAIERERRSGV